ncbi:glycosyltransferase family 25 protein [Phlyctema vagabunda]|uniref:Glycosyltransferase family 25 protein n=1 Tax=Phlyctema vagabunda TaxID=108571 RepID=A0ABR4PYE9_9HELO
MLRYAASTAKATAPRIGVVVVLVFLVLYHLSTYRYPSSPSPLLVAQNSTLGFGAIILISLPERTDRRDAVSLIASTSNITVTHTVAAVRGENILEKAKPYGKAIAELDDGHWGSWRSHLDALKYMVDNRIETALIVEDDVDWAPNIKQQMRSLAGGIQSSSLIHQPDHANYPYGTDWDVLHLGVSRIGAAPEPFNHIAIPYHDASLPTGPVQDVDCTEGRPWYCFSKYTQAVQMPDQSRVILPSYEPIGLVAIAVTLKGAQRLLYLLGWKSLETGLDWSIRDLMREGDLSGWTVVPPLFGSWTTGTGADSDLRDGIKSKVESSNNLKGQGRGLRESARQHLKDVMSTENRWQRLQKAVD